MMNALVKTQRKKRHMQFLTWSPNFYGVSWPPEPAFPSPWIIIAIDMILRAL